MAKSDRISPDEFGALFKKLVERSMERAPTGRPYFLAALQEHFGRDPRGLATVSEPLPSSDHPNLHLAVQEYVASPGVTSTLGGVTGLRDHETATLASLLVSGAAGVGPVQYANVALDGGRVMACVQRGLYLLGGKRREAILVSGPSRHNPWEKLHVEVMAATHEGATSALSRIRAIMRERNVYRGRVLSLLPDRYANTPRVVFHALRDIDREDIVLGDGILDRVERHALGVSKHARALLSRGRHLKRGMLLHGPPGTGKTLTAMYLAGRMRDRTTFLLTGGGLGLIEESCDMARLLQPATLIIEDVDLVAEERTHQGVCENAILFELLNQMDGLSEDSDVLFLLTTNRPEILEPALSSRPGRVDLAVHVPLPDLACRRRLIALYGKGLAFGKDVDFAALARKTDGASGAFIRELLRKAALFSADAGASSVRATHLDAALHELTILGGELTRSILGGRSGGAAEGAA